ncbi:MAG: hypothetical protein KDD50_08260 [Bdellovibrionales bacterium]|nr:hypothetical protein [Bdellovibrionales bacterium]
MRAVISIFSLIMFLSSQGLAHACLADCSHHQNVKASHGSDHSCCDDVDSSQDEENNHNCDLNHCFKSADFETSVLTLESRLAKKDVDDSIVANNTSYLIASHSVKSEITEFKGVRHHPPKVPLYIFYQKLLLP